MNNSDFAKIIDDLRESRNISRDEFVEGIVSERQYYRFLNGETSLKNEIIDELFEKLHIHGRDAHLFYKGYSKDITYTLFQINTVMGKYEYKNAFDMLSEIDEKKLVLKSDIDLYSVLNLILKSRLKKIPYNLASTKILKIINYPEILKNKVITYTEAISITFLFKYFAVNNDHRIAKFTYDCIVNKSADMQMIQLPIRINLYIFTSKYLGQMGEYKKSIHIAELAVKLLDIGFTMARSLSAYTTIALGYKNLGKIDMVRKIILKVYMILHIEEDNSERYKIYEKFIMENFELKESDLIEYKI